MKAAVVHAPNDIRYEEIDRPILQPGEVLIRVKFTGVCGSDVPRVNGTASHFIQMYWGNEFSGVVEEIFPEVTRLKPGDRVTGVPLIPCMACEDCLGDSPCAKTIVSSDLGDLEALRSTLLFPSAMPLSSARTFL